MFIFQVQDNIYCLYFRENLENSFLKNYFCISYDGQELKYFKYFNNISWENRMIEHFMKI